MITPVILSGGMGSRLWPLSRSFYPKQLQPLVDPNQTLLQQTLARCSNRQLFSAPVVVCNHEHRFLVGEQLQASQASDATIILEPEPKNTAPAIALAALNLLTRDPQALMLVMPADHLIANQQALLHSVKIAAAAARDGALVTFGVVPNRAETAYGYIKCVLDQGSSLERVIGFVEKPDAATANAYLQQGGYYWNGGLFMMRASAYLEELEKYAPRIFAAATKAMASPTKDLDFLRVDAAAFADCPSDSIDYAVMEKTERAWMVPLQAQWNDVGSWSSLWEVLEKDDNENATRGDTLLHKTHNSTVISQSRLVATLGVHDLVVVETPDAVLVAHQQQSQEVKTLVKLLEQSGKALSHHHRKVYRPWGWYDSIDVGVGFQVKRIQVKPQARLSKQRHQYRAEHWVVTKGVAHVLNGQDSITLNKNQSTYIPIGAVHSLHNPSHTENLEIIEVQTGSYLGEDDIERFEDMYGRAATVSTDDVP